MNNDEVWDYLEDNDEDWDYLGDNYEDWDYLDWGIEITSRTLSAACLLIPFDVIPRFLNLVREIIIWLEMNLYDDKDYGETMEDVHYFAFEGERVFDVD